MEEEGSFDAVPPGRAYQPDGLLRLNAKLELAAGPLEYRADAFVTGGNVASLGRGPECVDECPDIA